MNIRHLILSLASLSLLAACDSKMDSRTYNMSDVTPAGKPADCSSLKGEWALPVSISDNGNDYNSVRIDLNENGEWQTWLGDQVQPASCVADGQIQWRIEDKNSTTELMKTASGRTVRQETQKTQLWTLTKSEELESVLIGEAILDITNHHARGKKTTDQEILKFYEETVSSVDSEELSEDDLALVPASGSTTED